MFWKKKRVTREEDKIWSTTPAKWKGIGEEILQEGEKSFLILTVAHFAKTLEELEKYFRSIHLHYKTLDDLFDLPPDRFRQEGIRTILLLSERVGELRKFDSLFQENRSSRKDLHMIISELYPVPGREEELSALASELPCRATLCTHVSLDEPFMKRFGSGHTLELFKKLGWNEKDCLRHTAISKAIQKGQRKIRQKAIGDQRVSSAEEWFYYNCPELGKGRLD
jgi:hypothetical protein